MMNAEEAKQLTTENKNKRIEEECKELFSICEGIVVEVIKRGEFNASVSTLDYFDASARKVCSELTDLGYICRLSYQKLEIQW